MVRWLILASVLFLPRAADAELILKGNGFGVAVDPARLGVELRIEGQPNFIVSSSRAGAATVADLKRDDRAASWSLPDQHFAVSMRIDEHEALLVDFRSTRPGELTWPTIPRAPKAYILPMFEGVYIPAGDEAWSDFLAAESPMNTTGGLSMPFWGIDLGDGRTLTYVLTNPFNNELWFVGDDAGRLGLRLTHAFTKNVERKEIGFRIHLGDGSPVTPAKIYRQHLIDTGQFVSLKQKIEKTPDAAKLLGAAHVYLWGAGPLARGDVKDYKAFARAVAAGADMPETSIPRRLWDMLGDDGNEEVTTLIKKIPEAPFVDNYQKGRIVEAVSRVLERHDFSEPFNGLFQSHAEVIARNALALEQAFPNTFAPREEWGDGLSAKMVRLLADAGIDRAWLGSASWDGLGNHPELVDAAVKQGYLIGPYDSYHSIHPAGQKDTWETAQFFDERLDATGAIMRADGSKRAGFKQKGYLLSPRAARPFVERRVTRLMERFGCNSWFIDCDAFGDVFDDYSPQHPMTQASDAAERAARMAWISEKFDVVVGSEGGSAYAAPAIHFAHGVMTPVVGWGDPDLMKDKQSKFYLGGYYPPDAPAIFFKQVPMKAEHRRVYADPRFRLPLYQVVFHDSVVATHQWGYGSLKFEDPGRDRELLELLYNVPPLYHLNLAEWAKRKREIVAHHAFFSPLHREAGLLPMAGFRWLSDARTLQETTFGDGVLRLIANFGDGPHRVAEVDIPPHSILAIRPGGSRRAAYPSPN